MIGFYNSLTAHLDRRANDVLPTLARFTFAATLLMYFWKSGLTKLGDGFFGFLSPSLGAYAQIFPKAFEAVNYNAAAMNWFHWAVAVAGTWAEFVLPLLIVLGLMTRLAALGMIGFVFVQSLTDIFGHGAAFGGWFNAASGELIADQRAFWVLALLILVFKGAGPLSLDRLFKSAP